MIDSTYEDKLYQMPNPQVLSVNSRLTSCATLLCCACAEEPVCVAERYLALRTGCERHGRKNPLPYSFSQRSHVGNLRQAIQGKGEIHKRVETAGVYPLVRPRGVSARSRRPQTANPLAEVQRKTPRPSGANTLTQFECPAQPDAKKAPKRVPFR